MDNSRIRGHTDLPLTPDAVSDTTDLSNQIHTSGGLDALLTGTLSRNTHTADLISQGVIPIHTTPDLNGLPYGALEGMPTSRAKDIISTYLNDHPDIPLPGVSAYSGVPGQSMNQFKNRVLPIVKGTMAYADANPDKKVGLVVNRQTIRTVERWLNNGAPPDLSLSDQHQADYGSNLYHIKDGKLVEPGQQDTMAPGVYLIPHGVTAWNKPSGKSGGLS